MHRNVDLKIRALLLIILEVLLLSILGFNIMYDFSKLHSTVYYDILSYVSVQFIPILLLVVFFNIIIAVFNIDGGRLRLTCVLLTPFIYVMEVLVNYPNIWARDVYLHGQIWELDTYGELYSIHYLYPKEYPSFFLMLYGIYKILGAHGGVRYMALESLVLRSVLLGGLPGVSRG
jgi:hypothetical protein